MLTEYCIREPCISAFLDESESEGLSDDAHCSSSRLGRQLVVGKIWSTLGKVTPPAIRPPTSPRLQYRNGRLRRNQKFQGFGFWSLRPSGPLSSFLVFQYGYGPPQYTERIFPWKKCLLGLTARFAPENLHISSAHSLAGLQTFFPPTCSHQCTALTER